jgi:ABC-type nitrate/sulfonate/bicarbonate transport system substrate-binding protein
VNGARLFLNWCAVPLLLAVAIVTLGQDRHLPTLRVICLPNRPLAIAVGEQRDLFVKNGMDVQTEVAPNSDALRTDLANGKFDLAHAAVDNAVSMVEDGAADIIIVMGGEGSTNELIAQPGIRSIPELRGHILVVDAPNTAYALQLKKILLLNGLMAGNDYEIKPIGSTPQRLAAMREHKEYAASILGPPASLIAKHDGFVSLAKTQKAIGAYQGIGAFVRRSWALDNRDLLTRYLAAYVEAQRWILDPANKEQVIALLIKELKLSRPVADETYAVEIVGHSGYEPDARFDLPGFRNVLKLRAEVEGQWGGTPPSPRKYYDFSFYQRALSDLKNRR